MTSSGTAAAGTPGRFEQHGAARRAELLRDVGEFVGHHVAQQLVGLEDRGQFGDLAGQLVALLFQLQRENLVSRRSGNFEDVVGLDLAEVEDFHQAGHARPRCRRSTG